MSMLRNLREKKGLTVSQLAAKSSISSRVILEYEEGQHTISLNHAKLLAKALWVGIEDLMPPAGSTPAYTPPAPTPGPRPTPPPSASPAPRPQPTPGPGMAQPPRTTTDSGTHPRYEAPRTVRPSSSDGQDGRNTPAGGRVPKPVRPAPPPPGPITEGQLEELQRLAVKLEITTEQLEERVGKKLVELNRPEAKDWIKRARAMVEEIAPSREAPYGQWPESREDQEAAYLKQQQEAGSYFVFKLFNGEQVSGVIADFTPYTITIKLHGSNDEMVLRKLAIAYYRRTDAPADGSVLTPEIAPVQAAAEAIEAVEAAGEAVAPKAAKPRAKAKKSPADGVESDRAGEPVTPEMDNMDEDRGV
ncbi:MAG: helix-turn-helix transcriptional regulator [Chloroflexota bacterium]